MNILTSFAHPQVVANQYEFHEFLRMIGTKQLFGTIDFHSTNILEVTGAKVPIVLQNRSLCSTEERNSYRFATTRG